MPPSAPVAKLELAHRLREYRAASGETARAISARLGFSPNYLSALEHGREVVSKDKLPDLAATYELDDDEVAELADLIETSKLVGWWEQPPYGELLSDEMKLLCGLEQGAASARVYESVVITGLLQTPEYAEALIAADALNSRASIRHRVALRMKRQERLEGDDPLELTVVMSEAALMQQIGGPRVLRRQLEHLADLIDQFPDSLAVYVHPFTASDLAFAGASTLIFFGFDDSRLDSLLWREAGVPVGTSEETEVVELFEVNFASARELCLAREASSSLIRNRIVELGRGR